MFKITVLELKAEPEKDVIRYEQTVDELRIDKVIAAVNAKPRIRKPKAAQPAK